MPKGIFAFHWDERSGSEIIAQLPQSMDIPPNLLMQLFMNHEGVGDAGFIGLTNSDHNIASFLCSQESHFYVVLVLKDEEEADSFEQSLSNFAKSLEALYLEEKFAEIEVKIRNFLKELLKPAVITPERRFIQYASQAVYRNILSLIQQTGVMFESEAIAMVEDAAGKKEDVMAFLNVLLDLDLVSLCVLGKVGDHAILCVKDLVLFRTYPLSLLQILQKSDNNVSQEVKGNFLNVLKDYFASYRPSQDDTEKLMQGLGDENVWKIFDMLQLTILSRDSLLKKSGIPEESLDLVLLVLQELHAIARIDMNGENHYGILSSLTIKSAFSLRSLDKLEKMTKQAEIGEKMGKVIIEFANLILAELMPQQEYSQLVPILKRIARALQKAQSKRLQKAAASPYDEYMAVQKKSGDILHSMLRR
jgi:hypothetical protein